MNNIHQINVNQISSIKSYCNVISRDYHYKKAFKFLLWTRKEGYCTSWDVDSFFPEILTKEEVEDSGKYICYGEVVCWKPHVVIQMANNSFTKYFDTKEELKEFMELDELKSVKWIKA